MIVGPFGSIWQSLYTKPGGDKIGRRRLDTHFLGFQKLGAKFDYNSKDSFYSVDASELRGTYMLLDEASVTGTANVVMTAVMSKEKQPFTTQHVNLTCSNCVKCL